MQINFKKIIFCFLLILLFSFNFTFASTTLYQQKTECKISSGTILKKYNLFTDAGWVDINILQIDLNDKYTNLSLLTSSDGASKLKNVLSMAQESAAIAAINGDFFAGNNGKGHSIGLSINDSTIISSAAKENYSKNTFASFLLNKDNEVFFEYLTNKIILTSKKTKESIEIDVINKFSDDYSTPALYTTAWGEYSQGSSETLILTEMVVKNNKVSEIRYNESAVKIPENGFVISAYGEGAEFINKNFKKGTKISLETTLIPNSEDISFAVSGGAKLIDNGKIPETFSHNISGRNPRTALGVDENLETLYLVTVDGRQQSSIGMTQLELAEFLKTLEIYNAINLDGGGSTTMVAKKSGYHSLSTINNPSDGSLRPVINAIGIFSSAPDSKKLYGLNIEIEDTNIFRGEERSFKVTGYNKYFNPIEINQEDIEFDYSGVNLKIENNKISGNTVGSSILTASIGKISTNIEINILSDVNELFISPKYTAITPGDKVSYTIQAKNENGYYAQTELKSISIEIEEYYIDGIKQNAVPEDANISNNIFNVQTYGDYILSFSKGNIKSFALVSVTKPKAIVLEDFESETFKFDEYPDQVIGDASLSTEQVYSGKTSVKLEYNFNQDIQIRGAYIELNDPIIIPKDALSLSFWVYNDSYKDEKLKIKLKDSKGNTKLILLKDTLSHTGWKEINYDLSNVSLPATISDIYLAQDNIAIKNTGCIYIDNLIYYTNIKNIPASIKIPKDIKAENQNNNILNYTNDFKIALIDSICTPDLMIDNLKNKKLIHSINTNSDLAIITEELAEEYLNDIKVEKILDQKYDLIEKNNNIFITLDISNKSLRTTDATQWLNLQYDIKDCENTNIFIILNGSIDSFEDLKERQLFIDVLCQLKKETNKNITVLHSGYFTDYTMEKGIRFLGVNSKNISFENIANENSYILISIIADNISYEIKNIF